MLSRLNKVRCEALRPPVSLRIFPKPNIQRSFYPLHRLRTVQMYNSMVAPNLRRLGKNFLTSVPCHRPTSVLSVWYWRASGSSVVIRISGIDSSARRRIRRGHFPRRHAVATRALESCQRSLRRLRSIYGEGERFCDTADCRVGSLHWLTTCCSRFTTNATRN